MTEQEINDALRRVHRKMVVTVIIALGAIFTICYGYYMYVRLFGGQR